MKETVFVVLGGKYEQVPLILKAKKRGYKTATFDFNYETPGKRNSDYYFPVSYNDTSGILEHLSEFNIAGIATIGTNDAICVCAKLNDSLDLKGLYDPIERIKRATYKHLFKPHLDLNGMAVPQGDVFESYTQLEGYLADHPLPLLIKPSDASGSKGIGIVHKLCEAENAFLLAKRYARNGKVIVENYIGNNSYAVESFVIDNTIIYTLIAERKITPPPGCAGIGLTMPVILPNSINEKMISLSKKTTKILGITHGPVHMDMVINKDGDPFIVDIGPRLIAGPGGWEGIHTITGFDPVEAVIDQALGIVPSVSKIQIDPNRFFAHRYISSSSSGKLMKISYDKHLVRWVKHIEFFVEPGNMLEKMSDASHRYGYFTAVGNDFTKLSGKMDEVLENIELITE